MLGKTHLLFGLFVSLLGLVFFDLTHPLTFVVLVLFGSLFPDVDEPNSYLGRKVKIIGKLFKHRGFFHSVFALALFSWIIYLLMGDMLYVLGFAVGFLTHLVLDVVTLAGVKSWPLPHFRGGIKVGGLIEMVFFWVLVVANGWLLVMGGL